MKFDDVVFFHTHGYCVIENAVSQADVTTLRREVGDLFGQLLIKEDVECSESFLLNTIGCVLEPRTVLSEKALSSEGRHALNVCKHIVNTYVSYIFGPSASIFLLNENYIVKPPLSGRQSIFPWHADSDYDSQYKNIPYVSCWIALDDISSENGCLFVKKYETAVDIHVDEIIQECKRNSLSAEHYMTLHGSDQPCGFRSDEFEDVNAEPCVCPAGSLILLSHKVLHGSEGNFSNQFRRAYMPQFCWGTSPLPTSIKMT